jgi:Mg2+ and Co2+ transporter CorA
MNTILRDQQKVSRRLLELQAMLARNKLTTLFEPSTLASTASERQEDIFEPLNAAMPQGLQDIERLDAQAIRLSESLSELLQLKHAHSNAFELEFSRNLSLETTKLSRDAAKQRQAVLVFTIVNIVFSPLSFVAAFFTIQLSNLPHPMSLSYVSKYISGFGFAAAIPCVVLAFSVSSW